VIVEVVAMLVVEMAVMDEIHMVAMLHARMLFPSMPMRMGIGGDLRNQFLCLGIGVSHFERVFVDVATVGMMEMPVVEVIDMAIVFERLMTAALGMGMAFVPAMEDLMCHDRRSDKRKRQHGAEQGSMHDCGLHK